MAEQNNTYFCMEIHIEVNLKGGGGESSEVGVGGGCEDGENEFVLRVGSKSLDLAE